MYITKKTKILFRKQNFRFKNKILFLQTKTFRFILWYSMLKFCFENKNPIFETKTALTKQKWKQ